MIEYWLQNNLSTLFFHYLINNRWRLKIQEIKVDLFREVFARSNQPKVTHYVERLSSISFINSQGYTYKVCETALEEIKNKGKVKSLLYSFDIRE